MKFSLSSLKQHLDTSCTLEEILSSLTHLGIEVEGINNYNEKLKPFSVGYIESVQKHPNADKLKVCKVKTKDGVLQIVCGAHNARQGIYVIYAPDGSYIPGLDITLKKSEIRGIESCGMMLSELEMQLSDEHDGIVEMLHSVVGAPAAESLGLNDVIIEISITPNRGDLLGVRGIAKDLVALGIGKLKPLQYTPKSFAANLKHEKSNLKLEVNPEISKRFLLRKISGIKNTQSPKWLQIALGVFGQRSINALVDITNYVCFMLNQPMHAYDAQKIKSTNVKVDFAKNDSRAVLLDGLEYKFNSTMPLVMFGEQIGGLAGVKGALDSSCDESTTEIYLEAAHIDHKLVAFAKRHTNQNTESSYRFERQIDIQAIADAMDFATGLVVEICGGRVYDVLEFNSTVEPNKFSLSLSYINRLSGYNFSKQQIIDILEKLNFIVSTYKTTNFSSFEDSSQLDTIFDVIAPSYRNDIDGNHVVVAEIIRIFGSNNLPNIELKIHEELAYSTNFARKIVAKRIMASLGFIEQLSMSFISAKIAKIFNIYNEALELDNPISEDLAVMRGSIIPSLVLSSIKNINDSTNSFRLFENHNSYTVEGISKACTSAILVGNKTDKSWKSKSKPYEVWDIKAALFSFLENIGINTENLIINQDNVPSYFHPGQSGIITMGKNNTIAYFGKINPIVLEELGLKNSHNIYAFEVVLDNIPLPKNKSVLKPSYLVSPFTPVNRDFAFVIDETVKASEIIRIIKSVDKKHITDVTIFDIYKGDKLQLGKMSVAVGVTLESYKTTFTDESLQELSNKIISAVEKGLNAELRR